MNDQAGFKKIGDGDQYMYGPRGLLAHGLSEAEQEDLLGLAEGLTEDMPDLPVVFARPQDLNLTLAELLALPDEHGHGAPPTELRTIIMSGLTGQELHVIMSAWRKLGHTSPLWATVTPTSEGWQLSKLLQELAAEHAEMNEASPEA
jgi:hypothetical protein